MSLRWWKGDVSLMRCRWADKLLQSQRRPDYYYSTVGIVKNMQNIWLWSSCTWDFPTAPWPWRAVRIDLKHDTAKQAPTTKTISSAGSAGCRFARIGKKENLIEATENPRQLTSSSPVVTQCHIPEFVHPHLRLLTQAESHSSATVKAGTETQLRCVCAQ